MNSVEAIQLRRADEQMRAVRMDDSSHDPWAIKPSEYQGRANGKGKGFRRATCLGCAAPREKSWRHASYCSRCLGRVRAGLPVDAELWTITTAELRRLSCGVRFGCGLSFGRRSRP